MNGIASRRRSCASSRRISAPRSTPGSAGNERSTLRGTGGQLASKPCNGLAAKYLLSGLATCGVCGGSFGPRLAAGRSRHQVYRCLVNHTRGPAVCANTVQVPVALADTAVLSVVEAAVLHPDVITAAVAEALRRLAPERTERERARLLADPEALDARAALAATDLDALRRRVEIKLADWRGLFGRNPVQARGILSKVLDGRLRFTPHVDPVSGVRSYQFAGAGRLETLLSGVIPVPRPMVTPEGHEYLGGLPIRDIVRVRAA